MSKIHRIDLTSAWEPAGPNTWKRRFGRPSGLEPEDRVWLVLESPPSAGRSAGGDSDAAGRAVEDVSLNGLPLAAFEDRALVDASRRRVDVSLLLRPRNELVLSCAGAGGGCGAVPADAVRQPLPDGCGRVILEIEGGS